MGGGTREQRPLAVICTELNVAEGVAGERIGGAAPCDQAAVERLEAEIGDRPADSVWVALWRARRLARAVQNEWEAKALNALASAVERDAVLFN